MAARRGRERWNQIKADVTGFTVEVPRVRETATVGAGIVAAVGVGAHPDLPVGDPRDDRRSIAGSSRTPSASAIYDRVYEAYVALHPAIAPVLAAGQRPHRRATVAAA